MARRNSRTLSTQLGTIHCACCGKTKPDYGAELYSGDVCRCADCRKKNKPIPLLCRGEFEGIFGVTGERP